MAFEDLDGRKLKVLLAEHYMYVYGNRASVVKWKYHQKKPTDNSKLKTGMHTQAGGSEDEGVATLLSTPATPFSPTHSFEDPPPPASDSQRAVHSIQPANSPLQQGDTAHQALRCLMKTKAALRRAWTPKVHHPARALSKQGLYDAFLCG